VLVHVKEFDRLAAKHGLQRRVVPLSQHHPVYSCDDIEIWEVTRIPTSASPLSAASTQDNSLSTSTNSSSVSSSSSSSSSASVSSSSSSAHSKTLEMLSWGNHEFVAVRMRDHVFQVRQDVSGAIGCVLWPSSVVLSRYDRHNL
jgi:hypothetical protein